MEHPQTQVTIHRQPSQRQFGRLARSSARALKAPFRGECAEPMLKEASTELGGRVEPGDYGLEHEADVRPVPLCMRGHRAAASKFMDATSRSLRSCAF